MISDHIGRKIPAIISVLLMAGALLGFIWSHNTWMFYVFAVIFGFSWGGLGVLIIALAADTFRVLNLGVIMGVLEMGFAIGAAIGPAIGGYIFDISNGYALAFLIGAILISINAVLVALVRKVDNPG